MNSSDLICNFKFRSNGGLQLPEHGRRTPGCREGKLPYLSGHQKKKGHDIRVNPVVKYRHINGKKDKLHHAESVALVSVDYDQSRDSSFCPPGEGAG